MVARNLYRKEHVSTSLHWRAGFVVLLLGLCGVVVPLEAVATPQFERDIAPILKAQCIRCHGGETRKGELDLRTLDSLLKGGESGDVVARSEPDKSLLLRRVFTGEMPPEDTKKLTPDEVNILRQWIAAGMPADKPAGKAAAPSDVTDADRRFWAFRTLTRPALPKLHYTRQMRTPIDVFIISKLDEHKLQLSSDAEPVQLLRRVYFDLLGLPPSPEALEAYLSDTTPGAYERLVDQLLASPHFGERWGRHWLDTVGYTDTISYDGDTNFVPGFIDGRWRYRDYVIDSLNVDKPYDRFLSEQIAGDELISWHDAETMTPEMVNTLAATGFWRNSEDRSGSAKEIEYKWSLLHDTVQTFGTSLLGLTLRCARCHSHKYEPIPQEDYYQLLSLITPAFNVENWKEPKDRALPTISVKKKAEFDIENAAIEKQVAVLAKQIEAVRHGCELRLRDTKLANLPEAVRGDTKVAIALPVEHRDLMQRRLVEKFGTQVAVNPVEIDSALSVTEKATLDDLNLNITAANARRRSYGWIQAVYDVGPPPVTHLLIRGDHNRPGREVRPGFLSVLNDQGEINESPIKMHLSSSGRRSALARWLTAPNSQASSLVARVMVNRVWQHLTGVGIVPSSENLGRSGNRPTHPELLEWLAAEFVDGGWRIKPFIKQILMSSVYRQSSQRNSRLAANGADPLATDPGNVLLWRARLRRLESEAIRDSMLVVSGMFEPAVGGPAVRLHYSKDGLVSFDEKLLSSPAEKWRRSIYLFQRRVYHLTIMGVFNQPVVAGATCRRNTSAVALQSLSMLNDSLVLEIAEHFAMRVYQAAGDSPEIQVETAFRMALARPPKADEFAWSLDLLGEQTNLYRRGSSTGPEAARSALMHLCRVLFNATEFLYVE